MSGEKGKKALEIILAIYRSQKTGRAVNLPTDFSTLKMRGVELAPKGRGTMNVPFYASTREYQSRKAEFDDAVSGVMARGDFILGSEVAEFEREAAAFLGAKYAVGVASGSDALVIGADILGFRDGAEVLTPTFTFFASTSCVARLGGKPILVDMDPETLEMDLSDAERRMTKRTAGIIPVHLFIQPTRCNAVMALAKAHGLRVLEDAAEAWGMESLVDGSWRKAGTIGDIGVYSFSRPRPSAPTGTPASWSRTTRSSTGRSGATGSTAAR